jgi:hypothetical protein
MLQRLNRLTLNPPFDLAPERMDFRLRARFGKAEFGALILAIAFVLGFAYLDTAYEFNGFNDYRVFMNATQGDYGGFFYGFWIMPLLQAFNLLPLHLGYILWGLLNITGVWYAARVFGGNGTLALISYQMLYVVFYGNIAGIIVGALALMWWALYHRRPYLAGLAFLIAASKFQLGVPLGLTLLLLADVSWQDRGRVILVLLVGVMLSLILYPNWVLTLYEWTKIVPPNTAGSISPWRWFGALTLILWIPPLVLKLPPGHRLVAIGAALALASPYFQQTDLVALYALPTAWIALLGNLGYIFIGFEWAGFAILAIIPLILYIWSLSYSWRRKQTDVSNL